MTIFGCDLSDYDAGRGLTPARVRTFRGAGISFLTHKSTETAPGSLFKHTHMGEMLSAGRDAGIPFLGAYVVPRSGVDVAAQGRNHIAFLDAQIPWWRSHPGFFHQVDLEFWEYDQVPAWIGNALFDWLRSNGAGKPVVVYGSKGHYGSNELRYPRWNANYYLYQQVADFKSLYAQSGGDNGPGWGAYGTPSRPAEIWQYSDSAVIAGQGSCDANAFRGTEDDFRRVLGFTGIAPPPVQTEEPDMTPEQAGYFDSLVWRVDALIADKPVCTGGNVKGQRNMLFRGPALVRQTGKTAVWEADGAKKTRTYVSNPAAVAGRTIYEVADVTAYGAVVGTDPGNV